jgi:peptidoglycan/xylan/chitin deacetylase (PgdA/CDA1 family)
LPSSTSKGGDLLAARGLQLILWTVDSRDWAHPGVHQIVATVVRELRAGAIIVFHDGGGDRSQTVAALPQVLRQLHARGYRAVALPASAAAPAKRLGGKHQAGPIPAARVENVVL